MMDADDAALDGPSPAGECGSASTMPDPTRREAAQRAVVVRDAIACALAKWHPDIMAGAVNDAAREVVAALDAYEQAMAGEPEKRPRPKPCPTCGKPAEWILVCGACDEYYLRPGQTTRLLRATRERKPRPLTRADVERVARATMAEVVSAINEDPMVASSPDQYVPDTLPIPSVDALKIEDLLPGVWSRLTEGRPG